MKRRKPLDPGKPLARGKPLKARSSLNQRSSLPQPRKRIAQRSPKRTVHMRDSRRPMIEAMVAAGRSCEVCPVLEANGIRTHCARSIQGLHERRKSGAGGSRENPANLIPACNWGNGYIEDAKGAEREWIDYASGLVVREKHPEWAELGGQAWRLNHSGPPADE